MITAYLFDSSSFIHELKSQDLKAFGSLRFFSDETNPGEAIKSSTSTNTYLLPPILSFCMGPMRSIWIRSSGADACTSGTFLCCTFTYFSWLHSPHTSLSSIRSFGTPTNQVFMHQIFHVPNIHMSQPLVPQFRIPLSWHTFDLLFPHVAVVSWPDSLQYCHAIRIDCTTVSCWEHHCESFIAQLTHTNQICL